LGREEDFFFHDVQGVNFLAMRWGPDQGPTRLGIVDGLQTKLTTRLNDLEWGIILFISK